MKPNIYGFCRAGCQWETVHKADFDRSASIVRETPSESGNYTLDPFKVYKIKTGSTDGKYNASIQLVGNGGYDFTYDEFDEYRDYIIFEVLSVVQGADGATIVYEINGNRYSDTTSGLNVSDLSTLKLYISGAEEVFAYNVNAEILAETQQVYETAAGSEGGTCPDTLPTDELSTQPAPMYDGQRAAKVGDLVLYKYSTANAIGRDTILCKITSVNNDGGVNIRAICYTQGVRGERGLTGSQGQRGLTGATGAKIVSTVYIGQDANGGNIYQQTFDNGATATYTAQRGPRGLTGETGPVGPTGAKIVSTELTGQDANGGNIYKQTFDNGATATFTAPKGNGVPTTSASDAGKYMRVNSSGLWETKEIYVTETFTISNWTADALLDPFAYKADITASAPIGDNTILSLDIDAITAMAKGIAIGAVNGQVVSIYAMNKPAENTTIKLIIQN